MHVHGFRMHLLERGKLIYRAYDPVPGFRWCIDYRIRVLCHVPKLDIACGKPSPRPPPAAPGADHLTAFLQDSDERRRILPERLQLRRGHRQFDWGGAQMACEDIRVCRVDDSVLGRPVEEVLRAPHEVLIDWEIVRNEHRERLFALASGPPRLLPGWRNGARVAHNQAHVQRADVDSQLQSVGAYHTEQFSREQLPLNLPPLAGQIPAAVGLDLACQRRGLPSQALHCVLVDQLGYDPSAHKSDSRYSQHDELHQKTLRLAVRASPLHAPVKPRGVPEHELAGAARRAVVVDDLHRLSAYARSQLARVCDSRGAADECGIRPVVSAHPPEAPDYIGHVGTENAPIGVYFIYNHVPQAGEEPSPAWMGRQYALVEHVGIGENDIGLLPQLPTRGVGSIAIVSARPHRQERLQFPNSRQTSLLVLGQGFGRKDVQRRGFRIPHQRFDDGDVVAERLAAGCGGDDDDVAPLSGQLHSFCLVSVERRYPYAPQRPPEGGGYRRIHLAVTGLPRRNGLYVHSLATILIAGHEWVDEPRDVQAPVPRFPRFPSIPGNRRGPGPDPRRRAAACSTLLLACMVRLHSTEFLHVQYRPHGRRRTTLRCALGTVHGAPWGETLDGSVLSLSYLRAGM